MESKLSLVVGRDDMCWVRSWRGVWIEKCNSGIVIDEKGKGETGERERYKSFYGRSIVELAVW